MPKKNALGEFVRSIEHYPTWLKYRLMTFLFNHKVKLAGTARLKITHVDTHSVTFFQKNIKRVQNHIGGIHAASMALLAESATGFIVGINLPGDKLPLLKTLHVDYHKRTVGNMTAIASLTDVQLERLKTEEKGDMTVQVSVTDESGDEPIQCEMVWAWVPHKKR
jgi:acyl-coenzyme A thioesterase PaaI-like protein